MSEQDGRGGGRRKRPAGDELQTTVPAPSRPRSRSSDSRAGEELPKVGRFVVEATLGRGGMGRVFLARDERIQRRVALKVFEPEELDHDETEHELRLRFLNEARAIGRLSHPNIIEIYDTAEDDETGQAWIAMEHVPGSDLREILERGPELDSLLAIADDVAAALEHAHEQDIVHRDLKPANVLVGEDGRARLCDWGIAHLAGANVTQPGATLGSPAYMSPEQDLGRPAVPATDTHALALLLHEGLTGKRLRRRPGEAGQADPEALRRGPFSMDRARAHRVARVLNRSLAASPEERHARPGDLVAEIRAALRPSGLRERSLASLRSTGLRAGAIVVGLVALAFASQAWLDREATPGNPDSTTAPADSSAAGEDGPTTAGSSAPARPTPAADSSRSASLPVREDARPDDADSTTAPAVTGAPRRLRILLRSRVPGVLVVESNTATLLRAQVGEAVEDSPSAVELPSLRAAGATWYGTELGLPGGETELRFLFVRPNKGEVALLQSLTLATDEDGLGWASLRVQGLLARKFLADAGPGPTPTSGESDELDAWVAADRQLFGSEGVGPAPSPSEDPAAATPPVR